MSLVSIVLVVVGLALVIVGAVALVNMSWVTGAICLVAGLLVLGASRGGITL